MRFAFSFPTHLERATSPDATVGKQRGWDWLVRLSLAELLEDSSHWNGLWGTPLKAGAWVPGRFGF